MLCSCAAAAVATRRGRATCDAPPKGHVLSTRIAYVGTAQRKWDIHTAQQDSAAHTWAPLHVCVQGLALPYRNSRSEWLIAIATLAPDTQS
jgi:hypothetical protein